MEPLQWQQHRMGGEPLSSAGGNSVSRGAGGSGGGEEEEEAGEEEVAPLPGPAPGTRPRRARPDHILPPQVDDHDNEGEGFSCFLMFYNFQEKNSHLFLLLH